MHASAYLTITDVVLHSQNLDFPEMGFVEVCKWCCERNSEAVFESAHLCTPCFNKATQAASNPKLCQPCSQLFTNEQSIRVLFSEDGFSHSTAPNLRLSSENGCGLCRMLLLQDPNPDPSRLQMSLSLQAERATDAPYPSHANTISAGDVNLLYFSSEGGQFRLNLSVSALPDDPAAAFVSQRPIDNNLGDDSTTVLAKTWLSECLQSHTQCPGDQLPRLPTRVVDVGTDGDSYVKLAETSPESRSHYVTLSYCWGRPRFLTTLQGNVQQHKVGIGLDILPLTFRDAIATTRKLGFRYIWIDALCIIQDCDSDKAKEIGKMGHIYSESTLTLAVVSAEAVADGFLKTKPFKVVELPYQCPDGTIGSVSISAARESDLWDEQLYTRAWCLQENLLSTRLLLYTNTEIIWQCQTCLLRRPSTTHVSYVREDPKLGRSPFNRLPADVLKPRITPEESDVKSSLSDEGQFSIWRSLVENYTRRNLTVASDRLPALSGIAQKFREAWVDTYIFGVWERQLLPSLAWKRSPAQGQPHYPQLTEYRAPSWSWASIDGPVEFDFRFDLGNARGLRAKVRSCIHDQDSANTDAVMIEGYAIPVTSLPNLTASPSGRIYLDDHADDGRWPTFADTINDLDDEMKKICMCLLLGEGKCGGGKMMKTTALVVMPATGQDDDTFQRIGLWESTVRGTSKLWASPKFKRSLRIV